MNTGGWVKKSLYVGAYAGQTVTLQIRLDTDSSNRSSLFVDDVYFSASAAGTAEDAGAPMKIDLSQLKR